MTEIVRNDSGLQEIATAFGPAISYPEIVGLIAAGDLVLVNRTARLLGLGTGGYDFVMAVESNQPTDQAGIDPKVGHIIKLRYTPSQVAVSTLEEIEENGAIWDRDLDGLPVIVAQIHSQIPAACIALAEQGRKVVYIMTDGASLACSFSNLVRDLRTRSLLAATITAGQAFGGDYETVTVHSALLAARHLLNAEAAIICQGPGNAGTGTRVGFSGIEQAAYLDTTAALNGQPIALCRGSSADPRSRHHGISHHTRTVLALVRSSCTIALPAGMMYEQLPNRHKIASIDGADEVVGKLVDSGMKVTSMGRTPLEDPLFFRLAAAAGILAARMNTPL